MMKYIRRFENIEFVFERPLDDGYIIEDIKEMLLDIQDLGYENLRIWVNDVRLRDKEKKKNIEKIEIEISKEYNESTFIKKEESNELIITLSRIIDYLNKQKFNTKVIGYIYNKSSDNYDDFEIYIYEDLDLSKFNFVFIESEKK